MTAKEVTKGDGMATPEVSCDVYEMQMTQLQEQLISVMIGNESLKSELTELKEKKKVDQLFQELEFERKKTKLLYEELKLAKKIKSGRVLSKEEFVDLAQEATEEFAVGKVKQVRWFEAFRDYLISGFYELIADFTTDSDLDAEQNDEKGLTITQLKENIARFKNGLNPGFQLCRTSCHVLSWKTPLSTFFIFAVYLYSVWCGWLVSALLFMAITALSFTYLQFRGWNINFSLLNEDADNSDKNGDWAGVALSDKFNLVLQVANQVQNVLGKIADGLEKIKNLLTWQHPSVTRKLYTWLVVAFIMSCLMSGPTLFRWLGLYAGVKLFVIDYIYNKFPRFKHRHDSTYRMWKELPTDADLDAEHRKSIIDQQIIRDNISDVNVFKTISAESELSDDVRTFCTLFGLPLSERPLAGWEGGWRVTVIDKTRPLLKSLSRNGRLFLTNSFLCLERYKTPSPKNIMIPLKDITKIEKAKPYGWLPGSGMSIEIKVIGFEQPHTFGAILNRDECFERLLRHGANLSLPWAADYADVISSKPAADKSELSASKSSPEKPPVEKSLRMSDLRDNLDDDDDIAMLAFM